MKKLLTYIFIFSLIATLWSLYVWYFWDPIANLKTFDLRNKANAILPCNLCRYIRICTYPILIICMSMILTDNISKSSVYSILTLSILWLFFSVYKYYIEHFSHTNSYLCTGSAADCSSTGLEYFGFISLSLLSMVIFWFFIYASTKIIKKLNVNL